MKKILVFVAILVLAGAVYAADQSTVAIPGGAGGGQAPQTFSGMVLMQGKPGATKAVTVDNTAKSVKTLIEAAGGAFYGGTDGTLVPIGILLTCEDSATRWAFGGTAPTQAGVGHELAADSSWSWSNPQMVGTMQGISTDNTNDVCQITLSY